MLTARRLLIVVLAFALPTGGALAAEPGDADMRDRLDPTLSYAHVDTMYANLEACCDGHFVAAKGRMFATVQYDQAGGVKTDFTIDTVIKVPNKVQGFWSLQDALEADVRVLFSREADGVFAECMLSFQGFDYGAARGEAVARYGMKMLVVDGLVRPVQGVCDIEMHMKGIQVGMPEMEYDDLLETVSVASGDRTSYLRGFCK